MPFLFLAPVALAAHTSPLSTVVTFDSLALETPESMAFDTDGNLYVSLALTGEIRVIAPDGTQSTLAWLPLGAPPLTACGGFVDIMGALAIDHSGDLYVTVASCDAADRGVWRVGPDGETEIVAQLPTNALPNGITIDGDTLYVADSNLGLVWSVPKDGSAAASVWCDDPLLLPSIGHVFPGPNGVQVFRGEVYVANSDQGTILAIDIEPDGSAGAVRVHASNAPCDDFAFDVRGSLYCTTDPFNTVVRVDPDGSSTVLYTAADGLDGPSATVFGRTHGDRLQLYISNAAFPFFSTTHAPSVFTVGLGVPGQPRP